MKKKSSQKLKQIIRENSLLEELNDRLKGDVSRLSKENAGMEDQLRTLRPKVGSYEMILRAAKETYPKLKDVPLDLIPERLIELLSNAEQEALQHKKNSMTDALTGLHNVLYYQKSLDGEVEDARQNSTPLSLAYLDIDFFKQVNDYSGHPTGDAILKQVADLLTTLPKTYELARIGGEEFSILVPGGYIYPTTRDDVVNGSSVYKRLENLRKTIHDTAFVDADGKPYVHHNKRRQVVPLSVSIGLVDYNGRDTPAEYVKKVDRILYAAKRRGRDRIMTDVKTSPETSQLRLSALEKALLTSGEKSNI